MGIEDGGSMAKPPTGYCPYCSGMGQYVIHPGICPNVEAYGLYPDGTIRWVRFRSPLRDGSIAEYNDMDALIDDLEDNLTDG